MHSSLLEILVDPVSHTPLTLQATEVDEQGQIRTGLLKAHHGQIYPIHQGIPRFVVTEDAGQRQTEKSFGFKWQQENTYASPQSMAVYRSWLARRYGFGTPDEMQEYLGQKKRILDAGCGSGYSTSVWLDQVWRTQSKAEWVGADISVAIDVAQKRFGVSERLHFVQGDILQLPFKATAFDLIISEGVLHHTPSTERALKALVPLLEPSGELMFYVYRKKGAIREFSDDYIRDLIADLPPEQAWAMLEPLTKLGKALADLHTAVDVPEDIPYLGIKAGRYDVQRLLYWHFLKLFWNDAYTFEENQHVNFDWYHPRYAHRQTEEEVRSWCAEAKLRITHFDVQESGFTVRALREDA